MTREQQSMLLDRRKKVTMSNGHAPMRGRYTHQAQIDIIQYVLCMVNRLLVALTSKRSIDAATRPLGCVTVEGVVNSLLTPTRGSVVLEIGPRCTIVRIFIAADITGSEFALAGKK